MAITTIHHFPAQVNKAPKKHHAHFVADPITGRAARPDHGGSD
jgi:hypothetical protein